MSPPGHLPAPGPPRTAPAAAVSTGTHRPERSPPYPLSLRAGGRSRVTTEHSPPPPSPLSRLIKNAIKLKTDGRCSPPTTTTWGRRLSWPGPTPQCATSGQFISQVGFAKSRLKIIIGGNTVSLGATSRHLVTQPGRLVFLASTTEELAACIYIYLYTHIKVINPPSTWGVWDTGGCPGPQLQVASAGPSPEKATGMRDEGVAGLPRNAGPFAATLGAERGTPGVRQSPSGWPGQGCVGRDTRLMGLELEPPHAGLRVQSSFSRALPEQVKERGSTTPFHQLFDLIRLTYKEILSTQCSY